MGWLDRRGWLNRRGWSDGKCSCIQFGCDNAKFAVDWIRGVDQGGGKSCIYPLLFILSVGQSEVRGWSDWRGHKVVLSKKNLTWSPPASHFIHFLGYHLQDQSLYQKKKLTGVPLEKASSDIVRQPPPKKKGNSIRNIQILTSPNTKTSGTVVETKEDTIGS